MLCGAALAVTMTAFLTVVTIESRQPNNTGNLYAARCTVMDSVPNRLINENLYDLVQRRPDMICLLKSDATFPCAKLCNASSYRKAQYLEKQDSIHRDAIYPRLSLVVFLVWTPLCLSTARRLHETFAGGSWELQIVADGWEDYHKDHSKARRSSETPAMSIPVKYLVLKLSACATLC
jgi:hypothetical protein